ncbi:MAG TPA: preprotein translocase subunit SecE [Candidatus Baltobacteraceae bacterium]|jgi:preprotein translocase subunit SecE|nr:preprotein translocase subunit SecE [Candidatus Baltobacteraceae bacterium]
MNKAGGPPDAKKRAASQLSAQEFVRGVWLELRRVTWPTREEWISATVLTVVLVVAIGLFTFGADQLFGWIFSAVHPQAVQ